MITYISSVARRMTQEKRILVICSVGNQTLSNLEPSQTLEIVVDPSHPSELLLLRLAEIEELSIDEVKVIGILPDDDVQSHIFRVLKLMAKASIEGCLSTREAGQALTVDLKIQGFVDIMAAKDPSSGERFIVCQKPNWNIGASANVVIPVSNTSVNEDISTSSKWKMVADDLAEDDLVDEGELLNDGYVSKPRGDIAGCSSDDLPDDGSKRRACKNCSCGLAEEEAAAEASGKSIDASTAKSACGNCYKGDAFRCSSCPFLGKPAFEAGSSKVVLSLGSDDF